MHSLLPKDNPFKNIFNFDLYDTHGELGSEKMNFRFVIYNYL